ncbi:LysR family transcriptional regulator [Kitasatospora kifunensis]|uniref:DNA-binding transcriptional LysR family regulator n=1 Tax=Kitasatospora kifunensis TaxID=58351 RepID=A0A7W7R8R1_KITKI|nr:LysR family transcriptional regulator [Kitasatospora kifunensis]MBB4927505.1 DNA-binding transcriptional LysR family regulator [Kitasatospora kifunensis]
MDLVGACRVFVHVGERGSFTLGAAAAQVPQSVASRRIAALEEHFGARLFDRSARRAALTPFGRDMLASAKRLVQLADALEYDAEQAKLRPLGFAVPETCSLRQLAMLDAAARARSTVLDLRPAGPAARAELLRSHEVRAALLAVPPADADWTVPLGVGAATKSGPQPLRLDTLRPGRTRRSLRRLWIQPEDDVPHVRDRLEQLGHRAALAPAQITVAESLIAAVSETLRTDGFLLCSAAQAEELGLCWRPLAGATIARGYRVSAVSGDEAQRLQAGLWEQVARVVGVPMDLEES